jgi:hypothetical protein
MCTRVFKSSVKRIKKPHYGRKVFGKVPIGALRINRARLSNFVMLS